MDEREMLELAAKAAGIGPLDFDYAKREGHGMYFGPRLPLPQGVLMAANYTYWRPLTNDGDAFRLALKLELKISHRTTEVDVSKGSVSASEYVPTYLNMGEAARRAIVRAAAEIGRRMDSGSKG